MKKLFLATCMMLGITAMANAQTAATTKGGAIKPAATTKTVATDKTKPATSSSKPTKADGTPDMRYKANKDAAKNPKPAGPLKKDGTADMRYKANKTAAKPKKG